MLTEEQKAELIKRHATTYRNRVVDTKALGFTEADLNALIADVEQAVRKEMEGEMDQLRAQVAALQKAAEQLPWVGYGADWAPIGRLSAADKEALDSITTSGAFTLEATRKLFDLVEAKKADAGIPASEGTVTLKFCGGCGEGVTSFCRGEPKKCPMHLPAIDAARGQT